MTRPLEVKVNNNIEKALKDLKKIMGKEGVFKDIKRLRYYEKPSEKKKRKRDEAKRRLLKRKRRREYQKNNRKNFIKN